MMIRRRTPFFSGRLKPYNGVSTPGFFQLSETECGIAALAIIFSFYQFNPPFEVLREKCGTSRDGSKAVTLMKVARSYGFQAEAFKMELHAAALLETPVIAFWGFNHYVVIEGFGRERVFVNDPAVGKRIVSLEEFDKQFTGVVLSITPLDQVPQIKRPSLVFEMIQEWLSGFRFELVFLWIGMLFMVSSPLLVSAFQRIFIDQGVILNRRSWIPYLTMLSLGSAMVLLISTGFQSWNQFKLCTKLGMIKSSRIILHTLKLPLSFFSIRQKSEMIAMLSRTESTIQGLTNHAVTCMVGVLTLLICLLCMMYVDRLLALVSLLISAISSVSLYWISQRKLAYERANIYAQGKLYAASISMIRNAETIKACAFEEKSLKKWSTLFIKKLNREDKIKNFDVLLEFSNQLYFALATLMIFYLGGFRLAAGMMSVGTLMAYYAIHLFFSKTTVLILEGFKEIQTAYAAHLRIQDMLTCKTDHRFNVSSPKGMLNGASSESGGILSCEGADFFYNRNTPPALKDIQAEIQPGQHIALAGPTGSGKSTLARLLCGLYTPYAGKVTLDGRSLTSFTSSELAATFAYVSQDVTLFSGTLYDNLTLWKKDVSPILLEQAIVDACLTEVIEMRGLYGKVEEYGDNFSGGEKQRIDIARALIQNTPFLILDEATSALDVNTECKVIHHLRKRKKTIIFVAHRLSTIRRCDQIWVLKAGQIAERGEHQHLMHIQKLYFHLVKADSSQSEGAAYEISVHS